MSNLFIMRLRWQVRKLLFRSPPKGDVYYGEMAEAYDAERERSRRWHREQAAVRDFLARLPKGLKVLDVPIGTGRFVDYYLECDHKVWGLDSSAEMLKAAQLRVGADFEKLEVTVGDATALPYADAAFDLVVSTRFLRHVLPFGLAKKSLAEMARVTSRFAIIELGLSSIPTRWPNVNKPMRDRIALPDMVKLLEDHGFRIDAEAVTRRRLFGRRSVFLLSKINPA